MQNFSYQNGYQLKVDKVEIVQDEITKGAYDFTAYVIYHKEDSIEKIAEVSGRAHVYEQGKIANIDIMDDGGLLEALSSPKL